MLSFHGAPAVGQWLRKRTGLLAHLRKVFLRRPSPVRGSQEVSQLRYFRLQLQAHVSHQQVVFLHLGACRVCVCVCLCVRMRMLNVRHLHERKPDESKRDVPAPPFMYPRI